MHLCSRVHVWPAAICVALECDAREEMLLGFVLHPEINNLKVVFACFDLLQSNKNYYLYGNNDLFILQLVKCFILSIISVKSTSEFITRLVAVTPPIFTFYNFFCLWVCAENLVDYVRHQYLYFQ